VGGTFLPVGHDLAQWLNATVPGLVVVIDTTAGSVDNLERLVRGDVDFAIVAGHPFRLVLNGHGTLADEAQELCTVGTLYEDAEQFVIRTSMVRTGNLLDLSGLLMYPGPHNSGGETDTRRILTALGIEPRYVYVDERDLGYTAAAQALVAGDFDACTFSGGVPIRALTDLMQDHPGEFTILPFTRHMLNRLQHYEKGFEGVMLHPEDYPGLTHDIQSVGGPNMLVASPHVRAEIVGAVDSGIRRGIGAPGEGLRSREAHMVLQALDIALWNQTTVGKRCQLPVTAGLPSTP
jgi:TRAP transporter TAXI family solute receptor